MAKRSATSQAASHRGASTLTLGVADQLSSLGAHHRQTCVQTLRDLTRTWVGSLMTWLLIGIALALPVFLHLLLVNVMAVGQDFDGSARINVYVSEDVNASELQQQLSELPGIASAQLITSTEALEDFQAQSGFANILSALPSNPLPDVIELEPTDNTPAALRLLTEQLQSRAEVARVAVDLEWLMRLRAILAFGERFVATLAVFLSVGVALAVGNSIRLAIENRRSEIEIIKLVGATDAFVRRPFLYLGFWYGFGGALIAWLLVQVSFLLLSGPIEALLMSYQNQFSLQGVGFSVTLWMFLVGIGLGVGGAAIAVSRHLHTIEPT